VQMKPGGARQVLACIELALQRTSWFTALVLLRQCCASERWRTEANGGEQRRKPTAMFAMI
jgi:hypothetical protein